MEFALPAGMGMSDLTASVNAVDSAFGAKVIASQASGSFVTLVPEPATGLVIAPAAALLLRRRRR